jgi:hypothetical protein
MHPALSRTDHRPWPLPARAWVGRQSWHDLLFAHWPINVGQVRHLVPPALTIDEHGGTSWIGLIPFRMTGVSLRHVPDLPGISAFPELNVRLYVTLGGKPGVWFLSLDADQGLAVWAARTFMHLPYHRARMSLRESAAGIDYDSRRRSGSARFRGRYRALSEVYAAQPGSLDHWLTERYCLYASSTSGELRRTEIHHFAWPLQRAELELFDNTMLDPHGIDVPGAPPICHFARRLDVVVWTPERC